MAAEIVITGRGSTRSTRVRIAKALEQPSEFRRRATKAPWHSTIIGAPTSQREDERSIAIEILSNTVKEIFSEIDRSAFRLVDWEFMRFQVDRQ